MGNYLSILAVMIGPYSTVIAVRSRLIFVHLSRSLLSYHFSCKWLLKVSQFFVWLKTIVQ